MELRDRVGMKPAPSQPYPVKVAKVDTAFTGYPADIFDHMFGRFGRQCGECGGSQKIECPLCDGRGTIYAYKR